MTDSHHPSSANMKGFGEAPSPSLAGPLTRAMRVELGDGSMPLETDAVERLFELERVVGHAELLTYLTEHVHREQEIFWSRFGVFATIHAGALVLVTSDVVTHKSAVSIVGISLAVIWLFVQWISLTYADRPKRLYHWYRRSVGILWDYERKDIARPWRERVAGWIQRTTLLSSTDWGIVVPAATALLWSFALADALSAK